MVQAGLYFTEALSVRNMNQNGTLCYQK